MQEFLYLYNTPKNSNVPKNLVLENVYTKDSLSDCIVIRDETINKYIVHPKTKISVTVTHNKHSLHEVIFGWSPQKIKFDIDAYDDQISKDLDIVKGLKTAIIDEFFSSYFVDIEDELADDDFFITRSHGIVTTDDKSRNKISYHILVAPTKYMVADNDEAIEFTNRVKSRLSADLCKVVDFNVNKPTQNFRMLNTCKKDSNRKKTYEKGSIVRYTPSKEQNTFLTSLITYGVNLRVLPSILSAEKKSKKIIYDSSVELDDKTRESVMLLAKDYIEGFKIRGIKGNMIAFDRIMPSHCAICNEKHHKDNTLILFIYADEEHSMKRGVFAKCRHNTETRLLGILDPTRDDTKTASENKLARALKYRDEKSLLPTMPTYNVYEDPQIRDFPLCKTLFVKAQMKMGKTNTLKRYIKANYPQDSLEPKVIRVISFRRSFATEFLSKFKEEGFELYNDLAGVITHPRVIIQAESLFRLAITPEPIDLLILDESESIFEQIDSGLHTQFALSFAAFHWMLRTAKRVICMDALLCNRTYNIIEKLRGLDDAVCEYNIYKKAREDKYYFTNVLTDWIAEVFDAIDKGENIVINSSSLLELETVKEMIDDRFPDIKIGMYTSKTQNSIKKKHFNDVNTYWSDYRVLMVTPTVSAGISFEKEHYDRIFAYFTDMSCNTETCIQMLGRIRNVKSKRYYICVNAQRMSLPTDRDEIMRLLHTRHASIINHIDTRYMSFTYDEKGSMVFHNSDYIAVWLENTVIRYRNKNDFYGRLVHHIKSSGASVELLKNSDLFIDNPLIESEEGLMDEHKDAAKMIRSMEATQIATAEPITDDQAADISKKIYNQEDIEQESICQLKKHRLKKFYNCEDDAICDDFVLTFNNRYRKQQYKNLGIIAGVKDKESLNLALVELKNDEKMYKESLDEMVETKYIEGSRGIIKTILTAVKDSIVDAADISHRYMFDRIAITCELINICGWKTPFDEVQIDEGVLCKNLETNYDELKKATTKIHYVFEANFRMPELDDKQFLSKIIKNMNKILRKTFDINIKKIAKSKYDIISKYGLRQSDVFDIKDDRVIPVV